MLRRSTLKKNYVQIFLVYLAALIITVLSIPGQSAETTKKKSVAKVKKGENMFAIFETNKGNFKIRLFKELAPKTVENFVGLAEGTKEWTDPKTGTKHKKPFYNGLIFHRIMDDFMIQGGDPTGTGMGGPGYRFEDEFHPELRHTRHGLLSMANAGKNTNGSQFFITVTDRHLKNLDDAHSIFGEVVEGMDVVYAIGKSKTSGPNNRPVEDVVMKTVKIERL